MNYELRGKDNLYKEYYPENSKIMFIEEHFQVGGLYEAISPQILSLQKHYQNILYEFYVVSKHGHTRQLSTG